MLVQRETTDMYILKVTFSFRSIQEGELKVEADSRKAAAIPGKSGHSIIYGFIIAIDSTDVFSLFMQLLVLSVIEILQQIIIIKPVVKWCRQMLDSAK